MSVELKAPPDNNAAVAAKARLVIPRNEALKLIKAQIERGLEIKRAKIRYVADLERAREAKGEWTTAVMAMLKSIFNTGAVADECQNWHGKVLPEYADLNLFIEHFYDEMDQRLRKLHTVWKRIQDLPEDVAKPITSPTAAAAANPDFFEAATAPAAPVAAPASAAAPAAR